MCSLHYSLCFMTGMRGVHGGGAELYCRRCHCYARMTKIGRIDQLTRLHASLILL